MFIPNHIEGNKLPAIFENSNTQIAFYDRSKIQAWRNSKANALLACRLWNSIWNNENMGDENTNFLTAFTNRNASWLSNALNDPSVHLDIIFEEAELSIKSSNSIEQDEGLNDQLKNCIRFHSKEDFGEFSRLLSRDTDFESSPCFLKVRIHYTRDMCIAGARWEYPAFVNPSTDCKASELGIGKNAIVGFFTQVGHRFEKAINTALNSFPNIASMNPDVDIVIATGPLDRWSKERLAVFGDMTVKLNKSLRGKLIHIIPETISEEDLSEDLAAVLKITHNCCGWSEYQKLGAWNMIQYDSVLMIDFDLKLHVQITELFQCHRYFDFLSTLDPATALQGGFYLLRPNPQVYFEMKKLLATGGLYDVYSGWNNSGPLFSQINSDVDRIRHGKRTQAFAMETNQGFLFYFHYIYLAQNKKMLNLHVAQLEVCKYNFKISLLIKKGRPSTLMLACAASINEALRNKRDHVSISVGHGYANVGVKYGIDPSFKRIPLRILLGKLI